MKSKFFGGLSILALMAVSACAPGMSMPGGGGAAGGSGAAQQSALEVPMDGSTPVVNDNETVNTAGTTNTGGTTVTSIDGVGPYSGDSASTTPAEPAPSPVDSSNTEEVDAGFGPVRG